MNLRKGEASYRIYGKNVPLGKWNIWSVTGQKYECDFDNKCEDAVWTQKEDWNYRKDSWYVYEAKRFMYMQMTDGVFGIKNEPKHYFGKGAIESGCCKKIN